MLTDNIRNFLKEHYQEIPVKEVRIGLGYTGVLLDNGNAGVAYTFKQGLTEGARCLRETVLYPENHPIRFWIILAHQ
ncbi:MAG TPA: DUF4213 domain-containing protein [Thermodesulfobacteriota bacterium]|nr:DUF4213 domain-containing protein [Thermodesulfobacteriota bacterium]